MAEEEKASKAATKVQEAAANVQQASAAKRRGGSPGSKAEAVTRRYFEAIGARDVDRAPSALWAAGRARQRPRPGATYIAPEGVREFLGELIDAVPDLKVEIVSTTTEDERCARAVALQRHVRRTGLAQRHRADRRTASSSRASTC